MSRKKSNMPRSADGGRVTSPTTLLSPFTPRLFAAAVSIAAGT
jgi:hypothetical protein